MKRNCNLELCLSTSSSPSMTDSCNNFMTEESTQKRQQQFTIFYDGSVCVYDITEIQAKALIRFASQETEGKMKTPRPESVSQSLQSQGYSPPDLPMKRSLQRFLQKRKNRIQASSPYKQYSTRRK